MRSASLMTVDSIFQLHRHQVNIFWASGVAAGSDSHIATHPDPPLPPRSLAIESSHDTHDRLRIRVTLMTPLLLMLIGKSAPLTDSTNAARTGQTTRGCSLKTPVVGTECSGGRKSSMSSHSGSRVDKLLYRTPVPSHIGLHKKCRLQTSKCLRHDRFSRDKSEKKQLFPSTFFRTQTMSSSVVARARIVRDSLRGWVPTSPRHTPQPIYPATDDLYRATGSRNSDCCRIRTTGKNEEDVAAAAEAAAMEAEAAEEAAAAAAAEEAARKQERLTLTPICSQLWNVDTRQYTTLTPIMPFKFLAITFDTRIVANSNATKEEAQERTLRRGSHPEYDLEEEKASISATENNSLMNARKCLSVLSRLVCTYF